MAEMDKELKDRTPEYGLRIIRLCAALPRDRAASIIAGQLLKAGTSPAARCREALRARSKAGSVATRNGGLMELEEAQYRLEIVEGPNDATAKTLSAIKSGEERTHHKFRVANQAMEEQQMTGNTFCLLLSDLK